MAADHRPPAPARNLRRLAAAVIAVSSAVPLGALLVASAPGLATRAGAQVSTSQTFSYDGSTAQSFTVPPGVTHVEIGASGGQGGSGAAFGSEQETAAPGGAGDGVQGVDLAVTPGEQLSVDVGGAGGDASTSSNAGGAGGLSGDNANQTFNGGSGGLGVGGTAGAGGGGGGGSAVWAGSQLVVEAAGGGGGGGASVAATGLNGGQGGEGGPLSYGSGAGNGSSGSGPSAGPGGFFGTSDSDSGGSGESGSGTGGAGGGGGAGFLDIALGYSGGGVGGFLGDDGGGGGGGGGSSYVWSGTFGSPTHDPSPSAAGSVTISWLPSDAVAVSSDSPGQVSTGEPVTYTATVTTSGGSPDGEVYFFDGGNPVGTCQAVAITASGNSGTATCTLTYRKPGHHSITARYANDSTFPLGSSASPLLEQVVAPSVKVVPVAAGPTATGAPVLVEATVTVTGAAVNGTVPLTGAMTFLDDGNTIADCRGLGLLSLSTTTTTTTGTALCNTTFATTGAHKIRAVFLHAGAAPAHSSPVVEHVVAPATLYVTAGGTDTNNAGCAQASPCATLAHAVTQAVGGDTISLGAGTFAGGVQVTVPLTVEGQGPSTVLEADPVPGGQSVEAVDFAAAGTIENLAVAVPAETTTPAVTQYGVASLDTQNLAMTTISHVTVTGQGSDYGVVDMAGRTQIIDSSLSSNLVGAFLVQGSLTLVGTSVTDSVTAGVANAGSIEGGSAGPPQLAVVDSTVSGTSGKGGGFGAGVGVTATQGGTAVTDSTIADNAGGGVTIGLGTASVIGSTVAGNGGPGLNVASSAATLWVAGSLLAANTGGDCQAPTLIGPSGTIADAGYNLADDTTCSAAAGVSEVAGLAPAGSDLLDVNPRLSALSANGGGTETEAPPSNSPAVGTIPGGTTVVVDGTAVSLCQGTDQRGVARPQPAGGACDMGAVELAPTSTTLHVGPHSPLVGHPVTVRATVARGLPLALPVPAGTVSFARGGQPIDGCQGLSVSAGRAVCTTKLPAGPSPLTATYVGTNGYLGSSGGPVVVKVRAPKH